MKRINTYFISDIHFNHPRLVAELVPLRVSMFNSAKECDDYIKKKWNDTVNPWDRVIVVGDMFIKGTKEFKLRYINSLNGKKFLVIGNHDEGYSRMMRLGFEWACEEMVISVHGTKVKITHVPDYTYEDFQIHGHTHSTIMIEDRMINVCCEALKFTPLSLDKVASIIGKIKKKEEKDRQLELDEV